MVKITFLGTNGWFDSSTGSTVSTLIETDKYYIILDAGNGISKLNQYIKKDKRVYLFLSHFHLDHISGLHTLSMDKFSKGLYIIVQKGGKEILNQFIREPFTVPMEKLPFCADIMEVSYDVNQFPFKTTFLPLKHSTFVLGVRMELDGKIITYCTDTSYCENAVTLGKNADLLITECSMRSKETTDSAIHLNPELAAQIAVKAGAKKLILTHFDASRYESIEDRKESEMRAKEIFYNTYAGLDGLEIEI